MKRNATTPSAGDQEIRRRAWNIRRAGLQRSPAGTAGSDRETNQPIGDPVRLAVRLRPRAPLRGAAESDRPIAGLLTDLKARGLLDSTLVMWHAEFGRMPISQRGVGRDHNPGAMTIWMAGAGIKGGQAIGASDEFGYKAEQQPISYHDLHATILQLLGLDHTKLTYRFNGRDMRLTDVYGVPIPQIVA